MKFINTTLSTVADVMDELLVAYERATPDIDQSLVRKVMQAISVARRVAGFVTLGLLLALPCQAFDRYNNPDQYPSIGIDLSGGKLAGMVKDDVAGTPHTDGGFVKGLLDIRVPITNALTLHAFGSSTGINNNLQFSEGNEIGIGLRVYIH